MRQERSPMSVGAGDVRYTFFFQVATNGGRHACSVRVAAASKAEAALLFRTEWGAIELMVREAIKLKATDDRAVAVSLGV
jgi:hypothetical protein